MKTLNYSDWYETIICNSFVTAADLTASTREQEYQARFSSYYKSYMSTSLLKLFSKNVGVSADESCTTFSMFWLFKKTIRLSEGEGGDFIHNFTVKSFWKCLLAYWIWDVRATCGNSVWDREKDVKNFWGEKISLFSQSFLCRKFVQWFINYYE